MIQSLVMHRNVRTTYRLFVSGFRLGFSGFLASALLAGCGGPQPPISAPGAMSQSVQQPQAGNEKLPYSALACGGICMPPGPPGTSTANRNSAAIVKHVERDRSWMLPEAKNDDLLYISNSFDVTVYSYPKGKLVGKLRNFYRPLGECVDQAGDVFIANGTAQVFEYAHGGKKRIATLTMSGYQPESCAVDSTTGNLAVTWDQNESQGYVAIYQDAKGTPTLYSDGNMLFNFCGYDKSGNLFVDGEVEGSGFKFAELPQGGSTIENVTLDQGIEHAGAVQWDGRYVAVGDDATQTIY
jgi:hypothetical protein